MSQYVIKCCHLVAKLITNSSSTTEINFELAERIIQVMESMPWVRCASGNVCYKYHATIRSYTHVYLGILFRSFFKQDKCSGEQMVNDLLLSDVPHQRHASFATKVLNFINILVSDK